MVHAERETLVDNGNKTVAQEEKTVTEERTGKTHVDNGNETVAQQREIQSQKIAQARPMSTTAMKPLCKREKGSQKSAQAEKSGNKGLGFSFSYRNMTSRSGFRILDSEFRWLNEK